MSRDWLRLGVLVLLAACGGTGAAESGHSMAAADSVRTPVRTAATGWRVVRSELGLPVRVSLGTGLQAPGTIPLYVEVPGRMVRPGSVDLVSPSMPMHGIVRYETVAAGDRWMTTLDIPMAGDWSVYINLGDEADFAEVRFTVAGDTVNAGAHH